MVFYLLAFCPPTVCHGVQTWFFSVVIFSNHSNHDLQAMRVPDEGKLPVSWLAGNQGEYATSTEVNKIESVVILNVKTFFVSTETNFHRLIFMLFLLGTLGPERLHASRGAWSRQDNCPVATFLSNSGQLLVTSSPFENLQCFY